MRIWISNEYTLHPPPIFHASSHQTWNPFLSQCQDICTVRICLITTCHLLSECELLWLKPFLYQLFQFPDSTGFLFRSSCWWCPLVRMTCTRWISRPIFVHHYVTLWPFKPLKKKKKQTLTLSMTWKVHHNYSFSIIIQFLSFWRKTRQENNRI